MKAVLAVCFLALLALSLADVVPYPRGCIYVNGHCQRPCEVGTHAYTTGCGHKTPEPTCEEPHPVEDTRSNICDYTACYCDSPTVRDTTTNKCVKFEDCPQRA